MTNSPGVDPGYQFLLTSIEHCFTEDDLCKLIAAAAEDQWLKDSATGAVRVMDERGAEAGRPSRDPSTWVTEPTAVDGCYVVMYGPRGVNLVREALGGHAPPEGVLPYIEAEKAELAAVASDGLDGFASHRFKLAWRLQWVAGERRFALSQSEVPQLWWAVAQNVIVPIKVRELESKYPVVFGEVLDDPQSWGGAGHLAWALSKRTGDNLTSDPMYGACMAGVEPLVPEGGSNPGSRTGRTAPDVCDSCVPESCPSAGERSLRLAARRRPAAGLALGATPARGRGAPHATSMLTCGMGLS